jgi:hypothetical protein
VATVARDSVYEIDYERGSGWITFSAVVLGVAGTFNVVDGIVALGKSRFYTANAVYVFSDLRTWGWITLIVGAVSICAAVAVLGRAQWARWFGIAVASLSAIGQLLFVQAYPWWSLAVFALDVLVVYGLAVYGGRVRTT